MLFTDAPLVPFSELSAYETSIQDVAVTENIDLTQKLELVRRHLGTRLRIFLKRNARGAFDLANVVVTTELRHWLILSTLAEVYRDAYHSQLNDRYGAKWKEYTLEADQAAQELFEIGVGVVTDPVPRPGQPSASVIAGSYSATTYFLRAAWVGPTGQESAPSEAVSVDTTDDSNIQVSPPADAGSAVGWTLYLGSAGDACRLQTPTPLALDATWQIPDSGVRNGLVAGAGQEPEAYVVIDRSFFRG
jgi:hypothetical protein